MTDSEVAQARADAERLQQELEAVLRLPFAVKSKDAKAMYRRSAYLLAGLSSALGQAQEALRKVRAHTSYATPDVELLKGLLASVERIADAYFQGVSPSPAERPNRFDCAECGRGIAVDEDGCCRSCGADATPVVGDK